MTRNQRTFTAREKRIALTALIVAFVGVVLMTVLNPRPYRGAYETGANFDVPAGVTDARPLGAA